MLTCHVVILHHAASGVTAMAHYDEYVRERRIQKLVQTFCQKVKICCQEYKGSRDHI